MTKVASGGKKFRLIDVIGSLICVVFVAEAIAPAAAIGNAQFFWWIALIAAFGLPYGLVVSELGTTYAADEGGLYDWVRRAYGDKWASRVAWWYWINFPLWMASLAVLFPTSLQVLTGQHLPPLAGLAISVAFIWLVVFLSFARASDSIWIMNLAAALKIGIALAVGGLGLYYAAQHGWASDMSPATFLPSFDSSALTYLSIILFNFMGFEVIATFAGDMQNPRTQIPRAIITGGIVIAAIYLVSSFGLAAAIPARELSLDSGILDAVGIMTGAGSWFLVTIGVVFLLTLVGNMVSWSFGVNYVAVCAARDGNLPRAFASVTKRSEMPKGVALANGIIATALACLAPLADRLHLTDLFWTLFSVNVAFLLLSYLPMFPALLRLRAADPAAPRVFRVAGSAPALRLATWVPMVLIVLSVVVTLVPLGSSEDELAKLPGLATVVGFLVLGEVLRLAAARRRGPDYRGMALDGPPPARSTP